MKRSPVVAMLCVAVLAAVPMGLAVAWEADTQYRDWRNDPRPPQDTVKCADAQEAWLAEPQKRVNIDMSNLTKFFGEPSMGNINFYVLLPFATNVNILSDD